MSKVTVYDKRTGKASLHHAIDAKELLASGLWSDAPVERLIVPTKTPEPDAVSPVGPEPDPTPAAQKKKPGRPPKSA